MNGYKIKQDNNQWYFELFPCNNHNQAMGRSMNYVSLAQCKKAIVEFRDFVRTNQLNSPVEDKLVIKKENGRYSFQYADNGHIIFWRTISYGNKRNCHKAIESIYNNIDVYTSCCLEEPNN